MQILKGKKIYLRALEPEDLDFLYKIENDTNFWEVSSTETPFSRYVLEQYIANAHLDIYTAKQLRLIITHNETNKPMGMIDLFDYNPKHQRAGIGILLVQEDQQKGYASEALQLLTTYCFKNLNMHQLYANITRDNEASLSLFTKAGFEKVGVKKDWILSNNQYKDEVLFQLIHHES